MQIININFILGLILMLSIAGLVHSSTPAGQPVDEIAQPDLPPVCVDLQVGSGYEITFHAYAIGVQIYRWNGSSWDFVAPQANLYADADYHGKVGTHFAGPTWESNSGSNVVGKKAKDCTPNPNAIPWLKLESVSNEGPGLFSTVTYIQRVNTTGGLKPTAPGSANEEARVPYTAEYYFYQPQQ